jgi:hypothetical protein
LKNSFAIAMAAVGCSAVIYALGFMLQAMDLGFYAFWAPKYKAVERQVFEESKPYVQGKITYLNRLRGDYELSTEGQKPAIKAVIRREASQIKTEYLPADLRSFIESL